ncbi:hypothetical protein Drorol1_Dr00014361 [Drosera rotundifolia]
MEKRDFIINPREKISRAINSPRRRTETPSREKSKTPIHQTPFSTLCLNQTPQPPPSPKTAEESTENPINHHHPSSTTHRPPSIFHHCPSHQTLAVLTNTSTQSTIHSSPPSREPPPTTHYPRASLAAQPPSLCISRSPAPSSIG